MTGSFFGSVHGFFHSATWDVIRTLVILFVVVFWLATVYWVYKDARRRFAERRLVWISTAIGAIPPYLGPLVYMLFRPPEYLEDIRERELEIKAIERRLDERDETCGVCGSSVGPEFLVCPVCTTRLRQACGSCNRPLEPTWQVCPYCETAVGSEPVLLDPTREPRTRRTSTSSSAG
ncbi:MAG TPA: zinc ribbon domain-containing protein [Gaiellaceae bacterium]